MAKLDRRAPVGLDAEIARPKLPGVTRSCEDDRDLAT